MSFFQAITKKLDDPLISQGSTRLDEDRTVVRCVTGDTMSDKEIEELHLPPAPLVPLGRHGTECNTWLRMQLHDIDSGVRKRSGSVKNMQTFPLINNLFLLFIISFSNKINVSNSVTLYLDLLPSIFGTDTTCFTLLLTLKLLSLKDAF